jgi:hypothetical protein
VPRRLFDFNCPSGHDFEAFVDTSLKTLSCPICGTEASRIVSYGGPVLDPISGHFPSSTRNWARNRQDKIKAERKAAQD